MAGRLVPCPSTLSFLDPVGTFQCCWWCIGLSHPLLALVVVGWFCDPARLVKYHPPGPNLPSFLQLYLHIRVSCHFSSRMSICKTISLGASFTVQQSSQPGLGKYQMLFIFYSGEAWGGLAGDAGTPLFRCSLQTASPW